VLDDAKHYWVSPDEVDKLLRAGEGWLADHPDRELISRRYLAHQTGLYRSAISRLAEVDDTDPETLDNATEAPIVVDNVERAVPLAQLRHGAVLAALRSSGASRVADLGCGGGALLTQLLADPAFALVVGVDVSARALESAARRLKLDTMTERQRERLQLIQSSVTYRDARLAGLDALVLMKVIEHLDPPRLAALERSLFGHAAAPTVIVTTPNVEHNVRYESLPQGAFRHRDHRFEWTRAQLQDWAQSVAGRYGYQVRFLAVGTDDPEVGPPTQMALFSKAFEGGTVPA
jgi:3' terminal RNA ribose 2'-O-methyltransferase Hen1